MTARNPELHFNVDDFVLFVDPEKRPESFAAYLAVFGGDAHSAAQDALDAVQSTIDDLSNLDGHASLAAYTFPSVDEIAATYAMIAPREERRTTK